jgi:hydroxypyruvate reductase
MKPEILLIEPMTPEIEDRLDANYQVHRYYAAHDKDSFVMRVAGNVRAIVTGGRSGANNALIDMLPRLEIIATNGVGTDAVDLEHVRCRAIEVTTTPGVLTNDVADMGFALLLAAFRNLCTGDRFVRAGRWTRDDKLPLAHSVTGKRLGIFGMGRIGHAIARRAEGFGMLTSYNDLHQFPRVPYGFVPDLTDLARSSDVLVVAVAAGPQTRGIVNKPVLDAPGPQGILVNVARGSIVDEPALVAALVNGDLGGAGVDVFANEPHVPEALLSLENVVLQPHQASATMETRRAMGELGLTNLAAHFAGSEPLSGAA